MHLQGVEVAILRVRVEQNGHCFDCTRWKGNRWYTMILAQKSEGRNGFALKGWPAPPANDAGARIHTTCIKNSYYTTSLPKAQGGPCESGAHQPFQTEKCEVA